MVPLAAAAPLREPTRSPLDIDRGQLTGIEVVCIDNDVTILNGMELVLDGWGCRVLKAPDLASAIAAITETGFTPHVLLVDYHLDEGNGIEAIAELRRRHGADLTAILITADRSPDVRDEARSNAVLLLNKPVKPAALRALLTQVRLKRAVAAE
jgi:CheY-like chemotaxis protein